jgi:hypothetical protein
MVVGALTTELATAGDFGERMAVRQDRIDILVANKRTTALCGKAEAGCRVRDALIGLT